MSNQSSVAGKSTRQMAKRRRNASLSLLVLAFGIALLIYFVLQNKEILRLGSGTVLLLLIFLKILPDLLDKPLKSQKKAEKRAVRGAIAEEKIANILTKLDPQSFLVLHDLPSPYGNIDHIVIGKENGVFLLETKAHGGKVNMSDDRLLVNGKAPEKNFIAQALRNTYWLRDEIEKVTGFKVRILPVVVFTNAYVDIEEPIKGVYVMNGKFLLKLLMRKSWQGANPTKVWIARDMLLESIYNAKPNLSKNPVA